MINELDCRGMECPAPVLHVRNAVATEAPPAIVVLVDNDAARQNVSRFLEHQNYQVSSQAKGGEFRVVGTREEGASVPGTAPPTNAVKNQENGVKKIMVLVTSAHM